MRRKCPATDVWVETSITDRLHLGPGITRFGCLDLGRKLHRLQLDVQRFVIDYRYSFINISMVCFLNTGQ